jgi:hypothetical protein
MPRDSRAQCGSSLGGHYVKLVSVWFAIVTSLSVIGGFVLSNRPPDKNIRIHSKDLPSEGLLIIRPSDPSFDAKYAKEMVGKPLDVADRLRPFSVFLQNSSDHTIVAYMIKWCFIRENGPNECYQNSFAVTEALMEGRLPRGMADDVRQPTVIFPGSARLMSLISGGGTGTFVVPSTSEEAEKMRQGVRPNRKALLERAYLELGKFADVTVAIDGVFFDDGTFVGDNSSGFFERISAQIKARRDFLDDLNSRSRNKTNDELQAFAASIAGQPATHPNSKSTPNEYYNYWRTLYAQEVLSSCQVMGNEKALRMALSSIEKPWRVLTKKRVTGIGEDSK